MKYNQKILDFWKNDNLNNITAGKIEFPEGWDVREQLKDIVGEDSIVEVGCGYGRLVEAFNKERYLGLDINPLCIKTAKEKHPQFIFNNYLIDDPIPHSIWVMFYTVLLHVDDTDILPFLQQTTSNTEKVLIAEILGTEWRTWDYVFNREELDYDILLKNCGFSKAKSIAREYKRYNTTFKFLTYIKA